MSGLVLRDVEIAGAAGRRVMVRVSRRRVTEVAPQVDVRRGDEVVDGGGGALLPGLHDHHLHLLAMAAAVESVLVGPPDVNTIEEFATALRVAERRRSPTEWIRAVGYHESVAGELDRWSLDAIVGSRPVRVQHRSGALWILNTAALREVGREHDATGRFFRSDDWLRAELARPQPPHLAPIGARLATFGITGVTDATPYERPGDFDAIADAVRRAELPFVVTVTGGPALSAAPPPSQLRRGPTKIVLADHALPAFPDLVELIDRVHRAGRPVAVHCVSRISLVLLIAAIEEAGAVEGDRVEHASVVPPEMMTAMADLGLTVVTQPGFIRERGEQYLREVDADDRPWLYPCASLLRAGVRLGGSTDAPFGDADPWRAVATAITRRTVAGTVVGRGERVHRERALALFLSSPVDPGGPARAVTVGGPADLCLLDLPLRSALAEPCSEHVALTIHAGQISYRR